MNRLVLFSIYFLISAILIYVLSEAGASVLTPGILHRETNILNIKGISILDYYSGIVDALSHIVYGVKICRVNNVYSTIMFAMEKNVNSFYLMIDNRHVRGFVIYNGSTAVRAIDYSDPSYVFNPSDSIIMKCTIVFDTDDIYPNCNIIYFKGEYSYVFKDEATKILEYDSR